jgi:hypothetical protein
LETILSSVGVRLSDINPLLRLADLDEARTGARHFTIVPSYALEELRSRARENKPREGFIDLAIRRAI